MAIPTYEDLMLPLLSELGDGKEKAVREIIETLSNKFDLSKDDREKLLPSGKQRVIANRVGWARTHLNKTGLLEYAARGVYKITPQGLEVLRQNPNRIDNNFLRQFPAFVEWFDIKPEKINKISPEIIKHTEKTPRQCKSELKEQSFYLFFSPLSAAAARCLIPFLISRAPGCTGIQC